MQTRQADRTSAAPLMRLTRNVGALCRRIEEARRRGPAPAAAVTLLVVTKAAPAGGVDLLAGAGVRDVGENRVASALERRATAPRGLVWHGIGHLQTNKARRALEAFDVFHALDSLHLADRLEALLSESGRSWPVYAQVNAANDPAKGGVPAGEALAFLAALASRPHLDVVGWMTMAREEDEGEAARPAFRRLREIRDEALRRGIGRAPAHGLSMGMSADFEVAVEEGATIVRLGRAVWDGVASAGEGGDSPRAKDR